MKVLIINKHREDTLGGSELQCDLIASELTDRGNEVFYLAISGTEKDYGTPYNVVPCGMNPEDIKNEIGKIKPDVIYWRFNRFLFYTIAKYSSKKNIPFIFAASSYGDVHPWEVNKKVRFLWALRRKYQMIWHRLGFYYIDALTVNNKEYLQTLSVPKQVFVPNGVIEKSIPFSWDKPFCIWVANIKQIKRPELYIKLAKEFESENIDFLMVGAIQEEEYDWIEHGENLPENLHYVGSKTPEEVNGMLAKSLLQIHTCYPEGFPNIFIQAWLQGIPSVTYGFDPSNYIEENKMGYNAGEKWSAFVSQVRELIDSKEKRNLYGKNAEKFSREVFRIQAAVDKLEELMGSLVAEK